MITSLLSPGEKITVLKIVDEFRLCFFLMCVGLWNSADFPDTVVECIFVS